MDELTGIIEAAVKTAYDDYMRRGSGYVHVLRRKIAEEVMRAIAPYLAPEGLLKDARDALLPYVWAAHWRTAAPEPEGELGLPEGATDYHLEVTEADMVRAQRVFERLERAMADLAAARRPGASAPRRS